MPWVKGQSGNPIGPYNARQLAVMRRVQGLTLKAVEVLADTMENGEPHLRLAAAKEVLDRSLGKPKQQATVEVQHNASPHLAALVGLAASAIQRVQSVPGNGAQVIDLSGHEIDETHLIQAPGAPGGEGGGT